MLYLFYTINYFFFTDRHKIDGSLNSSEDESFNDNASVVSNFSENRSAEDCDDAEDVAQEHFEEKLSELLDGLTQKSSQGRINCFQSLTNAFIKKSVPTFIKDRYVYLHTTINRIVYYKIFTKNSIYFTLTSIYF